MEKLIAEIGQHLKDNGMAIQSYIIHHCGLQNFLEATVYNRVENRDHKIIAACNPEWTLYSLYVELD